MLGWNPVRPFTTPPPPKNTHSQHQGHIPVVHSFSHPVGIMLWGSCCASSPLVTMQLTHEGGGSQSSKLFSQCGPKLVQAVAGKASQILSRFFMLLMHLGSLCC